MEQGLGDMIQFIRYAALVKERGGRVLVECPGFLIALFSTCPGIDQLVAEGTRLPGFDVHAPLMSLPYLVQGSGIRGQGSVPYLYAKAELVEEWANKIGVSGQGSGVSEQELGVRDQGSGVSEVPVRSSLARGPCPLTPFRIGICWQGNPHHRHDRYRSIPLRMFAPLTRLPEVRLISLQKRVGAEQVHSVADEFEVMELPSEQD